MATPKESGDITAPAGPRQSQAPGEVEYTHITVDGAETVVVPHGTLILDADYSRLGHDLVMVGQDGTTVHLHDYFLQDVTPDLMTEGGAVITADMAARLAGPLAPGQYAQAGSSDVLGQPIGHIENLEGTATATRADGTQVTLKAGDPIFADDILETGPDGALGLVFIDKSTMSMADGGRIILDEMVYGPSTHLGVQAFNVVRGAFVFASGIIGKNDPDSVTVSTPVATIGIRGTKYGVEVAALNGETTVTLFEGAVAVGNDYGLSLLSSFGDTTAVGSSLNAPSAVYQLDENGQRETYGRALSIHPAQPPIDTDELNNGDRTENDPGPDGGLDTASGPTGGGVGDTAFLSEFDNSVDPDPLVTVPDAPVGTPTGASGGSAGGSRGPGGVEPDDDNNNTAPSEDGDVVVSLDDVLVGTPKAETLDGGAGNDTVIGGGGADHLKGGSGNDEISVEFNDDSDLMALTTVEGGSGFDLLKIHLEGADKWNAALDQIREQAAVLEDNGGEFLVDSLSLKATGIEALEVYLNGELQDLSADDDGAAAKAALPRNGAEVSDNDMSVSLQLGGNGSDTLSGTGGKDVLAGQNGDDRLIADSGDDLLLGGRGNDLMEIAANVLVGGDLGEGQDYGAVVNEALGAVFDRSGLEGTDRVRVLSSGDDPVSLKQGDYDGLHNVEILDLTGIGGGVSAALSLEDVVSMTDDDNALTIWHNGDASVLVGGVNVDEPQSYSFDWNGKDVEVTVVTPDVT